MQSRRSHRAVLSAMVGVLAIVLSIPTAIAADPVHTQTWFTGASNSGTIGVAQTFWIGVIPWPDDGGQIELRADGVLVGTTAVQPGLGSMPMAWMPDAVGAISMTASFSGSDGYAPSISSPQVVDVHLPPPTSVDVTSDLDPAPRGADVTVTATITPDPDGGTVIWHVDGEAIEVPVEAGGVAHLTRAFDVSGTHQIEAEFTGSASFSRRVSVAYRQVVLGDEIGISASVPQDPMPVGPVTMTVTLSDDPGGGVIDWEEHSGPHGQVDVGPGGVTEIDLGSLSFGHYSYQLSFLGFEPFGKADTTLTFDVRYPTTTSLATDRPSATIGELPVVLTATIGAVPEKLQGTVIFEDDVAGSMIALGPVPVDGYSHAAVLSTSSLRVGTHSIRAVYSGDSEDIGSSSAPVTVVVAPDSGVHATFTPTAAKFYPNKDRYRDTVVLGGRLDEKSTVTIRIYDSHGVRRRTFKLGSEGPGSYGITWDGRTKGGSRLAAGKYTVKASFTDLAGNSRSLTTHVTTSWRKAVRKSVDVRINADKGTYFVDEDGIGRLYYSPDYVHGVILDSGEPNADCPECGWAGGRFRFTLHKDVLAYRALYVQVAGHGFTDRDGAGWVSILDPVTGGLAETSGLIQFAPSGQTFGVPFSHDRVSPTRRVEAWVWMSQQYEDAFDLRYVRLQYKYIVWA